VVASHRLMIVGLPVVELYNDSQTLWEMSGGVAVERG